MVAITTLHRLVFRLGIYPVAGGDQEDEESGSLKPLGRNGRFLPSVPSVEINSLHPHEASKPSFEMGHAKRERSLGS